MSDVTMGGVGDVTENTWAPLQRVPKIACFSTFLDKLGISIQQEYPTNTIVMNNIIEYLKLKGYRIGKTYKAVNDIRKVFIVYLNKKRYIAKICDSDTELQALKYFQKHKFGFTPKLHKYKSFGTSTLVIMEFLPGKRLSYYRYGKHSALFWKVIIVKIIKIVAVLEKHKILHNDLWEDNIIVYKNNVKLIDFEYTHQYTKSSKIYCRDVMSQAQDKQAEKLRLGWSRKFHLGGDLNQILGILSDFSSIPEYIENNIKKIVIQTNADFPYASLEGNPSTIAEVLLRNLDVIFKKP